MKLKYILYKQHQEKTCLKPDILIYMSLVMRKSAFCICENKDTDQLRSNCAADQCLFFRYTDSTIPLLPKSEISSLYIAIFCGCKARFVSDLRSETPKSGFLKTRLIYTYMNIKVKDQLAPNLIQHSDP